MLAGFGRHSGIRGSCTLLRGFAAHKFLIVANKLLTHEECPIKLIIRYVDVTRKSAYSSCEELHQVLHSPEHVVHSHQPEAEGVHRAKVPGGVLPRSHGHHACNGELAAAVPVELLDSCEGRFTGVVCQDPTINVVVTLSEVHGGSRRVASHLPDGLCVRRGRFSMVIFYYMCQSRVEIEAYVRNCTPRLSRRTICKARTVIFLHNHTPCLKHSRLTQISEVIILSEKTICFESCDDKLNRWIYLRVLSSSPKQLLKKWSFG